MISRTEFYSSSILKYINNTGFIFNFTGSCEFHSRFPDNHTRILYAFNDSTHFKQTKLLDFLRAHNISLVLCFRKKAMSTHHLVSCRDHIGFPCLYLNIMLGIRYDLLNIIKHPCVINRSGQLGYNGIFYGTSITQISCIVV